MTVFKVVTLLAFSLAWMGSAVQAQTKHKDPKFKVSCTPREMKVELVKPSDVTHVYLEHLKQYPEKSCKPVIEEDKVTFSLDLKDIFKCMVTKVVNRASGLRVYYHRVVLEHTEGPKQSFFVKCSTAFNSTGSSGEDLKISKRSAQREEIRFIEDEEIEITGEVTGRAPIPELISGVRQNNVLIDDELTVKPGTPLEMEIGLDRASSDIYGVSVSYMEVTDTKSKAESLIFNGCSVDPQLFQNFKTEDGDQLRAEFRAFKFPESNFVLFKGMVNVCLDWCTAVKCANGEVGYGKRRRRDVSDDDSRINKIYEVSMATIVKVAEEPVEGTHEDLWLEKATLQEVLHPDDAAIAALSEEFGAYKYIDFQSSSTTLSASVGLVFLIGLLQHILMAF